MGHVGCPEEVEAFLGWNIHVTMPWGNIIQPTALLFNKKNLGPDLLTQSQHYIMECQRVESTIEKDANKKKYIHIWKANVLCFS